MGTYLTLAELQQYVESEIVADTTFLANMLAAAERGIDGLCGRRFNPPANPPVVMSRSYRPSDDVVHVHDLADAAGLIVTDDGQAVDLADIQLEPLNGLSSTGEYRPFCTLRRLDTCWTHRGMKATVTVTSDRWGWTLIPPQVKAATGIAAKDLVHLRKVNFGIGGFDMTGAVVRVRDNPHVQAQLTKLLHPNVLLDFA